MSHPGERDHFKDPHLSRPSAEGSDEEITAYPLAEHPTAAGPPPDYTSQMPSSVSQGPDVSGLAFDSEPGPYSNGEERPVEGQGTLTSNLRTSDVEGEGPRVASFQVPRLGKTSFQTLTYQSTQSERVCTRSSALYQPGPPELPSGTHAEGEGSEEAPTTGALTFHLMPIPGAALNAADTSPPATSPSLSSGEEQESSAGLADHLLRELLPRDVRRDGPSAGLQGRIKKTRRSSRSSASRSTRRRQSYHEHATLKKSVKWHHPFGGMPQFAALKTAFCGWEKKCLMYKNHEERGKARTKLINALCENYKTAFVACNMNRGLGLPKANNLSSSKMNIKTICERNLMKMEVAALAKKHSLLKEKNKIVASHIPNLNILRSDSRLIQGSTRADAILSSAMDVRCFALNPKYENCVGYKESVVDRVNAQLQDYLDMRGRTIASLILEGDDGSSNARLVIAAMSRIIDDDELKCFVSEAGDTLGCQHIARRNKIFMDCCKVWAACEICHRKDHIEGKKGDSKIKFFKCMVCGEDQTSRQVCQGCNTRFQP